MRAYNKCGYCGKMVGILEVHDCSYEPVNKLFEEEKAQIEWILDRKQSCNEKGGE